MPQTTRNLVGTYAGRYLSAHDADETVIRFGNGLEKYNALAHLRTPQRACWNCGAAPLPSTIMGVEFCCWCGKPLADYDWVQECREELEDAFNQVVIAIRRGELRPKSLVATVLLKTIAFCLSVLAVLDCRREASL